MLLKLYDWLNPVAYNHIASTSYPPGLVFYDAHVKSVKYMGLVNCQHWMQFFVKEADITQ